MERQLLRPACAVALITDTCVSDKFVSINTNCLELFQPLAATAVDEKMAAKEVELKEIKNGQTVDDDEPVQSHVVPPDGGYGWVIMGAAFLCNVVVDGIIFSIGLVVAALADSFEVEISKATWVGSLLSGFYLIAGDFSPVSIDLRLVNSDSR